MKTKSDTASALFLQGYNCAQAALFPFCEALQIDENTALKMACGFGGGMGRKGEVCGAVSGGILAIGLKHGRGKNDDGAAGERTNAKTQELMEQFAEKNGHYICRKLLNGCDLTTAEGRARHKENDDRNTICLQCVRSAVEILERIL
jgi:C_GCAxxG_C_C family probable redox protein